MTKTSVSAKLEEIESKVMSGLKDFQRATVNRIDELYRSGQMRILISDEVGLGKTLIARGTIAKFAKIQKERNKKFVKVVYVCSNAAIAQQNLDKLRITRELTADGTGSSRLSMQHLNIFNQENDAELHSRYIQLIPLTPDTSFRMSKGQGTVDERALMFALLKRLPELSGYTAELEYIMNKNAPKSWEGRARDYEQLAEICDYKSKGKYFSYMRDKLLSELNKPNDNKETLLDMLIDSCRQVRKGKYISDNGLIKKLRYLFAEISLDKLEPDLVIMDEFQRFKYLIKSDPKSDTGMLANRFFNSKKVKMLLLSATPYKMYSTLEEIDENQIDEHYSEFFDVMDFLNVTDKEKTKFRNVWNDYSVRLKEMTSGDISVITAKNAAENALYRHICRTERISEPENADIIDDTGTAEFIDVTENDIRSFLNTQKLLDNINTQPKDDMSMHFKKVPIDYIKSCPYIMSFMHNYKLKQHIEKHFTEHPENINKLKKDTFWLNRRNLDMYEKLPNNNARLELVMGKTFQNKAEMLLWVPPSRPYYPPQGIFRDTTGFTKTLIFSSWEMVPRMLSGLLSYEAERKTVGKLARQNDMNNAHYFYAEKKRYPSARLNFSLSNNRPNAMTLFCLIYPSQFLTDCYDPIDCMNRGLSLKEIERELKAKISEKLKRYRYYKTKTKTKPLDKRWYYLLPLLLDEEDYVEKWLDSQAEIASYNSDDDKTTRIKGFSTHLSALKELYFNTNLHALGRMPDDLTDVLADMAIASPAVSVNRTYRLYESSECSFRNYIPSQIARIFLNRMNTPESTAAVELSCGKKSDDAHWQNVLKYCKHGNFQAMFDEYVHMLSNGFDKDKELINNIHNTIIESMDVRTTIYNVDTFSNFKTRVTGSKEKETKIRSHFAVSFTQGDGKEKDNNRKMVVRNSFNSPFRPFVLASTSIGQEGLDFHNYCRRIVHWNLPSNPIDLEQREGRINRFKCLAIRQNIVKRYGSIQFKKDIWQEMFDEAVKTEKNENVSDLIPFWGITESDDMIKIERIVPMYPFSKDGLSYERLVKILSLYRLTLGQARQEELLEHIFNNCTDINNIKDLFINLSPYYKTCK